MKILILGGHGFIGHNVAQQLINLGHRVGTVDVHHRYGEYQDWEYDPVLSQRMDFIGLHSAWNIDVCDAEKLKQVFAEFSPDVVIDLATYPNAKMVKKNVVDATTNMIAATAIALDLCVVHIRAFSFLFLLRKHFITEKKNIGDLNQNFFHFRYKLFYMGNVCIQD